MSIVITIETFKEGYQGIFKVSLDNGNNEDIQTIYKKDGIEILHHEQTTAVQNILDTLVLGDDIYEDIINIQNKL